MDPNDFDTGRGSFDTDETRVFARLAEEGHPIPPPLLSYAVDATLAATPGRSFTERVRLHAVCVVGVCPRACIRFFFFWCSSVLPGAVVSSISTVFFAFFVEGDCGFPPFTLFRDLPRPLTVVRLA